MAAVSLREFAPAKVNLYLHLTGRRADGYHLLDSLAVFPAVGDWLRAVPAEALSLTVEGPFGAALRDEADNLVLRAARALRPCGGARITLEKHLPVASGIGGGSADAAAALRLLARLWDVPPATLPMALALGADVPVCLGGSGRAHGWGGGGSGAGAGVACMWDGAGQSWGIAGDGFGVSRAAGRVFRGGCVAGIVARCGGDGAGSGGAAQ